MASRLHREGHNCWARPRARRAALLVDGERYYRALASAIERAERTVWLLGWDFHSRVRLRRDGPDGGEGSELVSLLQRQVRRKRRLRVRILAWDFSMIYALEREFLPLLRFDLATHRRIHFRLDDRHPLGASQHQKIAVIDDAVAFSGGLDLTACRWDTREHRDGDPRRNDPGFPSYGPFHDVQLAVDGQAAVKLGALARERWRRAGGRRVRPTRPKRDPWPPELEPDLRDVDVAISRTLPAFEGRPGAREVEQLYLDQIAAARESLYIENQYLSSHRVGDALIESLQREAGPEIVIVVPANLSGWLEESTMGVLRTRIGRKLRDADRHGRLSLLRPVLPGKTPLTIHSKVLIADDRILRVGSANLSNRSMGFDSECDLSVESTSERDCSAEIRRLRDELVGEHLGAGAEEVAAARERTGSLRGAIDALGTPERGLVPVDLDTEEGWIDVLASSQVVYDPERPVAFDLLSEQFSTGQAGVAAGGRGPLLWKAALGLGATGALAAAWRWTPLADGLSAETLSRGAQVLGGPETLESALVAVPLFALASSLMVPATALVLACGALFGFAKGALISLVGALLGAALGYALGSQLWGEAVRRITGPRVEALARRLLRRGVLAAVLIRLVPVAPFGAVNLLAGASHLRAGDFLIGTGLGMLPGICAIAWLGDRTRAAIREPEPLEVALALVALAVVLGGALLARRWLDPLRED